MAPIYEVAIKCTTYHALFPNPSAHPWGERIKSQISADAPLVVPTNDDIG